MIHRIKKKGGLLLLGLAMGASAMAQTSDLGLWTTLEVQKDLGKWDFAAESEFRLKDQGAEIDRWSLGLSGAYQLFKPIKIGAGYDFIYFNDTEYLDFQPRHRASVFVQGKHKVGRFTVSLREKVQGTAKDVSDRIKSNGNTDNYKVNPEYTWRNKLKLEYNIPKIPLSPAISVESFHSLNNPEGNGVEQIRYTLLFNYKLSKKHQFEAYGMYSDKSMGDDAAQRMVVGLGYQFKF